MKNKGFESGSVGSSIRMSKSTMGKIAKRREVSIATGNRDSLVATIADHLEAARKVQLVRAIQTTRTELVGDGGDHRVTLNALDRRGRMDIRGMIDHRGVKQIAVWTNEMPHRAFISI